MFVFSFTSTATPDAMMFECPFEASFVQVYSEATTAGGSGGTPSILSYWDETMKQDTAVLFKDGSVVADNAIKFQSEIGNGLSITKIAAGSAGQTVITVSFSDNDVMPRVGDTIGITGVINYATKVAGKLDWNTINQAPVTAVTGSSITISIDSTLYDATATVTGGMVVPTYNITVPGMDNVPFSAQFTANLNTRRLLLTIGSKVQNAGALTHVLCHRAISPDVIGGRGVTPL